MSGRVILEADRRERPSLPRNRKTGSGATRWKEIDRSVEKLGSVRYAPGSGPWIRPTVVAKQLRGDSQPRPPRCGGEDFRAEPVRRHPEGGLSGTRRERAGAGRDCMVSPKWRAVAKREQARWWEPIQDLDKDDYVPEPYRKASSMEVEALSFKESQDRKRSEKKKQTKLQELGFEVEHAGETLF